mmetsp:Transcript_54918/g.132955  ORF Transcript_54918/g.132955 Transcript_54918/m.132955 type:complete len:286 (-) Transcript_54918:136-993(-)|eukprot:CAMPEP_0114155046 /NCGR_PEP_ID=MMETSP0043_2-20121206/25251_1 /TAXON_ID=464988 /ORGANISM="Hemiselmis andersenii, Strain CCMP644" /LENGTH=285 /DNA_ID=CAMNT_0001250265 /DNA_START=51 /DNA_END=908 /DNA_ORIENTATION=-
MTGSSALAAALFLTFVASAGCFTLSALPLASQSAAPRLSTPPSVRKAASLNHARVNPVMQVWNFIPDAAAAQQRDPARLMPLKALPPNIVVRPAFKKAEPPYQTLMERANPGDFGPDMMDVVQLGKDVGGKGPQDVFQQLFMDQGWRSYLVAEDINTGEIVGCAQLSRIQVGGYVYLTDDLQIKNLYVKDGYRRLGVANHLIHNLLGRLKPTERAWAFCEQDSDPFFTFFSSGFVGIKWAEAGMVFPGALWFFLWPFHFQRFKYPNTVYFAAEGRGGGDAFNPAG